MILNIVSYQFAKNYTNINLLGYLNVIKSYSRKCEKEYNKQKHIKAMNYLYFLKLFYKYIKDYNKDRNFLFYEMRNLHDSVLELSDKYMIYFRLCYKKIEIEKGVKLYLFRQIINK